MSVYTVEKSADRSARKSPYRLFPPAEPSAIAITMLPADEASLYARMINRDRNLENLVLNRESSKEKRMRENIPDYSYKEHLPLTWRFFHSEKDNVESLTPVSFSVMEKILRVLAEAKTPV